MKWRNLRIRTKLSLASGTVIILLLSIGAFALFNINSIGDSASGLSDKYLPLTILSNNISNTTQKALYAQKGFSKSYEQSFIEEEKKHIDSLKIYIEEAKQMANTFSDLTELTTVIESTEKAINDFTSSITETEQIGQKIVQNHERLQQLRIEIITEGNNYIASQRDLINYSLRTGVNPNVLRDYFHKIEIMQSSLLKTNEALFYILKAKSEGNIQSLASASENLNQIDEQITGLQKITRRVADNDKLSLIKNSVTGSISALYENTALYNKLIDVNKVESDASTTIISAYNSLTDQSISNTKTSANQTVTIVDASSKAVVIGLIITIIVSLIFANFITRSVTKSIKKGVAFAKQVASGDLEANIDLNQKDEIGQFAVALQEMVEKLRNIIHEVLESANSITEASLSINSNAQMMSQGANEQASAAQQVSSSMEEMVANIHQNTENSKQTEKISINAATGVKKGADTTLVAVDSMRKIAEKISIINDIAFQTNILALNAAVEAARAGEHGRGFAVVAAEVRKLAERSKVAAEQIDQLSKSGVSVSESAGQQLQAIVPEIENTAKLIQEITSASLEQNAGAEQINHAIQQLNMVTQQNAAASESMATSAEQLSEQASKLKEVIAFFKIKIAKKTASIKNNISNNKTTRNIDKNSKPNTVNTISRPKLTEPEQRKTEIKAAPSVIPEKKITLPSKPFEKPKYIKEPVRKGTYINLGEPAVKVSDDEYERF
jgi:methyl-accepting chemotaxis protein